MTQTLRPDSNVTQTNVTGGYAEIDESSPSDADWVEATVDTSAILVVGLSNPSATPGGGTTTFRYRIGKTGSNAVTITPSLYEGTTLIDAGAGQAAPALATTYSWTPDTSTVSNWNNLRLRFGFSRNATTYGKLYWAELEVPAPAYRLTLVSQSYSATLQDVTLKAPKTLSLASASFGVTASAITFRYNRILALASASYTLSLTDPTLHRGYSMSIASASYVVTMNAGTPIAVDSAAYAVTAGDITFRYNRVFSLASASFTVTASNITLGKGFFLEIGSASLSVTLSSASFAIREANGWNIPKYPELTWGEAAEPSNGEWVEAADPTGDWSEAA